VLGEWRGNAYKILVEKPEGKKSLGRSRRRWEDNIRKLGNRLGNVWSGLIWLRIGTGSRLL
jgi:hypothetical protein